jgi:uncharacterized protein YaiL (DUF2058 family)
VREGERKKEGEKEREKKKRERREREREERQKRERERRERESKLKTLRMHSIIKDTFDMYLGSRYIVIRGCVHRSKLRDP